MPHKVGTMIELPRAAVTANEIAKSAEFFSFGTNDLTQMTWGFSRDDVESSFFSRYLEHGIFQVSPFESLDVDGVGRLVRHAARLGRQANPDLHLGVCGEHGGDPASIHFFDEVGLDYVSCSPFRVPVARLEAGAGLGEPGGLRPAGRARLDRRARRTGFDALVLTRVATKGQPSAHRAVGAGLDLGARGRRTGAKTSGGIARNCVDVGGLRPVRLQRGPLAVEVRRHVDAPR